MRVKVEVFMVDPSHTIHTSAPFTIEPAGYLTIKKFNRDEAWHLCNWECWADREPKECKHCDVGTCGAGVIFHAKGTDEYHLALSMGWHVAKSLYGIKRFINEIHNGYRNCNGELMRQ